MDKVGLWLPVCLTLAKILVNLLDMTLTLNASNIRSQLVPMAQQLGPSDYLSIEKNGESIAVVLSPEEFQKYQEFVQKEKRQSTLKALQMIHADDVTSPETEQWLANNGLSRDDPNFDEKVLALLAKER